MESWTEESKLICGGIVFLSCGLVIVLYALNLSAQAANSDIAPATVIYLRTATTMYLAGIPMLLTGGGLLLNAYIKRDSGNRYIQSTPRKYQPVAGDGDAVVCPECGFVLWQELAFARPDGSVICSKCLKRFIPPT